MKALILESHGSPYILKNIEIPEPGKGEVLVRVMASGVNPLDLKIKGGQAAHAKVKLPAIPGIDMAGIVEKVGQNVTAFKVGDEVFGMTGGVGGVQGSLAEYIIADANLIAIKPSNLTMKEAAALPLSFITAWEGLVDRANVAEGKTVLVHGGSGGVGHIAVQIAVAFGARVFATDKEANKNLITSYGAGFIDFTNQSTEEYVDNYTDGEGFDIIFDTIGGATLDESFKAVKTYYGHVVSILGWGNHSLAPLSFRGATYSGVFTLLPLITGKGRQHHGEILQNAAKMAEAGKLIPRVDPNSYTLETIEEAYQSIENRTSKGKVVISISNSIPVRDESMPAI